MNKHSLRVAVVAGTVAVLVGGGGAIAWADTFTPAIEEPTYYLDVLQGTPLTGTAPRNGRDGSNNSADYDSGYDTGYGGEYSGDGDPGYGSTEDDGYWRTPGDD